MLCNGHWGGSSDNWGAGGGPVFAAFAAVLFDLS